MEKLDDIIFYTIDQATRTYRQYAQGQLKKAGYTITIDQWLVIKNIIEEPNMSQQRLARKVFKDNASVTRMIEILVREQYLARRTHDTDRRRTSLEATEKGIKVISEVQEIVLRNRRKALKHISVKSIQEMRKTLLAIIKNCRD
jgi:MarR family transcriptional regulator for hemolysin